MVIPGTPSISWPVGPYTVIAETKEYYTIGNGVGIIKLNKDRFSHIAPAVVYIREYVGNGLMVVVTKHKSGFAISSKDIDTDNWLPLVNIYPIFVDADRRAKEAAGIK